MKKNTRRFLALFMALAILAAYSFSPQNLTAFAVSAAEEPTVTAQEAEQKTEPTESTQPTTKAEPTETTQPTTKAEPTEESQAETQATPAEEPAEQETEAVTEESGSEQAEPTEATEETEPTEDEQKEDEEYPAKTFKGNAGGVHVEVIAPEGAFLKGTEMTVKAVGHSAELDAKVSNAVGSEVEDYKAVDITFHNDGKEVQPEREVQVNLNASGLDVAAEKEVVHVSDSGNASVVAEASANGAASVPATHFSKYIIAAKAGDGEEVTEEVETWTVTFYNRDGEVYRTVKVPKEEAIGDQMPSVIEREDYNAFWAVGTIDDHGTTTVEERITSEYVPTKDTSVVPDYDPIKYTITFYTDENKSEVLASKEVTAGTSYCLNDIPAVPEKAGYSGKWVYSGGNFTNKVAVRANTDVWAVYDQNEFIVTFKVEGKNYQSDKYYKGDKLTLPTEPVVEGKQFVGWFIGETEYVGGETINSDLEITAEFTDQYKVDFVVVDDDGETTERLSQYFRDAGETIGTMPQNPFVAGKVFEKWVIQDTDTEVTADTVVNDNITAVAQFRTVDIYSITAQYYYLNDRGEEVVFNTDLLQAEAHELPYTITAPSTTQTDPNEVAGAPIYYPETPTVEIEKTDFNENKEYTARIKYVPYTAEYDFVYKVKDLTGDGYTEIPNTKEHVYGVLNSYVTPTVKSFDNYTLELAEGAQITQAEGQELVVKYTRKNFQLTYDTKGGSYVEGTTVPYGTNQPVTNTVPTRAGYTFGGWYLDENLTQEAGSTVTVNGNTTLYAKWNGNTVDYTIVYMFEKYNDAGTQSSFVYDNSETGRGTVGSTVYANDRSIPDKTKKGWEKDDAQNATSSVVITADGSAVLLVYYKLKSYTFTFTINGSSNNNRYRMTIKGNTYRGSDKYSFTAKLGQDISADWPINGGSARIWDNNNGYYFYYWSCQGTGYASKILRVTEELLPNNSTNISVTGNWRTNNSTIQVNYYLQNADNNDYTLSTLYSQTAPSGSYNPKEISGYTYSHSDNDTDWWGDVTAYNFYYNRHTYQIEYYHGTDKLKTIQNVKYDATITSNTYNWTPTKDECGVDSDYIWGGWYDNPECNGTPYTFSKMPAGATNGSVALVLYAKWNAPSYTVSFVDGDHTETKLADDQNVEKHKKATAPETSPTKAGYIFDGWYTTANGDALYDWNKQITEDTTIYAHWTRATLSYTVHYVDEDGEAVATDKVVTNPNFAVGQSITEQAIAVAGYRPQSNSETITLAENNSDNSITFVYSEKAETTSYTVKYVIAEGEPGAGTAVAAEKTVSNVPGDTASVIEMAKAVDYTALYTAHPELKDVEFFPDEVEKTLVLTADPSSNVFTFYYSSFKHADVTVNFVDMDGNPIADADTQKLKVGKTFTLSRTPIAGWELKKAVEGTSYSGETAGSDYKITEATTSNGLTFTLFYQKKVTITAKSLSKQYDGTELKLPVSIDGQVTVEGLPNGASLTGIDFTYANADNSSNDGRINAGVATVTPKDAMISGTHTASNYYSIRYISGTLEVTRINVTIRVEPDRWTGIKYDGTEYQAGFTNPNKGIEDYIMISHDGYKEAYLEDIWNAVKAKATYNESAPGLHYYGIAKSDVGDYTYNIDLKAADLPENDNYSVSLYVRPGRLQIVPAEVTVAITGNTDSKEYNGSEQSVTGYEISIPEGVTLTKAEIIGPAQASAIAKGTNVDGGSNEDKTYPMGLTEDAFGTINNNYTVTFDVTDGWLKITPAELTVKADNKGKVYGEADPALTTTVTGMKGSDTEAAIRELLGISVSRAEGEDVGEYTITPTGETTLANYTVSYKTGTFTITPAELTVTITGNNDTKTYTGSEQSVTCYEISIPDGATLKKSEISGPAQDEA
ncbi:MAG: InlB B-repeat-containing protein, partial [Firmicutes bacterium]|nr:InlB B-repeat-containing protein [Bacillota bacterium]